MKRKFFSKRWAQTCLACVWGMSTAAFGCPIKPQDGADSSNISLQFEKIYCQIVKEAPGHSLPNINDFRKNNATIQYLLLRTPAKQLGITLPKPKRSKPAHAKPAYEPYGYKQKALVSKTTPQQQNTRPKAAHAGLSTFADAKTNQTRLENCTLERTTIACPYSRYHLVSNKSNTHLKNAVFSDSNKLDMPSEQEISHHSAIGYLSEIYPTYIDKMLALGLGDSTMSFTKFHASYQDIKQRGDDFSQRFYKMYELLKEEKQRNAIAARYRDNYPSDIQSCMPLSDKVIVCDNVVQNWVYQANR